MDLLFKFNAANKLNAPETPLRENRRRGTSQRAMRGVLWRLLGSSLSCVGRCVCVCDRHTLAN